MATYNVNFRNSSYRKSVIIGKRTIKEGEAAAVWNVNGTMKILTGPQRKYFFCVDVTFLDRYIATDTEYLVINFQDGHIEHKPGPFSMFSVPTLHQSITKQSFITVGGAEAVVLRRRGQDGSIERSIVQGPTIFMPQPNEELQTFNHTTTDNDGNMTVTTRQKIPLSNKELSVSVLLRTVDDVGFSARFTIAYEISDIKKLLDAGDITGNMSNAIRADLRKMVSTLTYTEFLAKGSELSDLDSFPLLLQSVQKMGVSISQFVYVGCVGDATLLKANEAKRLAKEKLAQEKENEQQAQYLQEVKLGGQQQRAATERALKEAEVQHTLHLQKLQHEARMLQKQQEHQQQISYLAQLASHGVDLTKYLVAQQRNEKVIKIESEGAAETPAVHVHND
eukprot:Colp12_sorted_trinity150504_noHs@12296